MYSTSELDELFQILNLIEKDLNLKGLEPHWSNTTLETQDVNASYVQVMHDYYDECYKMKTKNYMSELKQAAERPKNDMYNNTLDGVSAKKWQQVYEPQMQSTDQHDVNAENHTQA